MTTRLRWTVFALITAIGLGGPLTLASMALASPGPDAAIVAPAEMPPAGTKSTDPTTGKPVVVATPAAAPGGAAPLPETSVGDVVAAARAGKWLVAIGGALILLTALLRWLAGVVGLKWFATDRGGAVLVGLASLGGCIITTAAAPGAKFDLTTIGAALAATWAAAGGYTWLKSLFSPRDQKPADAKVTPPA